MHIHIILREHYCGISCFEKKVECLNDQDIFRNIQGGQNFGNQKKDKLCNPSMVCAKVAIY